MTKIVRPVILAGIGRCGSTMTHEILSRHERTAWLSGIARKLPGVPAINGLFCRAIDIPVVGTAIRRNFPPSEHYPLWRRAYPGFAAPFRDLSIGDVTHKVKRDINAALEPTLTKNRDRLLLKITGWPRLAFLEEVFEQPYFVHVVRDGRAVTNSMLNVDWWWGWRGPQNWRWGELPSDQKDLWEKHDRSFVALAAIEWNIIMDAFETAKRAVPEERYLEVKYEDICADPIGEMKRICEFCDLPWTEAFAAEVSSHPVRNSNDKWKSELTEAQHAILQDVMAARLSVHGYG